jgi:2'-5' RNA ligase
MTDKIRAFIAIGLPEYVLHGIGKVQAGLKQSDLKIKWVRKTSVHLTLKFLGDIPLQQVGQIGTALQRAVRGLRPFSLSGRGVGVFPDFRRPRVVWTGISGDVESLQEVYAAVEHALKAEGFAGERRPFRAHLTVGRIKGPINKQLLRSALAEQEAFETDPFKVASVILYQSTLQPQGAVYTRLAEALLLG